MTPRRFARGVRREPGAMNKLEAKYADHLRQRQIAGEVAWFEFESWKLRLAPNTFYTPDFIVMLEPSGEIEFHEVKGFWEDDARVKIKVAAASKPFRFIAVTWKKGEWQYERFGEA